jgi:hypothetical protein
VHHLRSQEETKEIKIPFIIRFPCSENRSISVATYFKLNRRNYQEKTKEFRLLEENMVSNQPIKYLEIKNYPYSGTHT